MNRILNQENPTRNKRIYGMILAGIFTVLLLIPIITSHSYTLKIIFGCFVTTMLTLPHRAELKDFVKLWNLQSRMYKLADICIMITSVLFIINGIIFHNITYCLMGTVLFPFIKIVQYEVRLDAVIDIISYAMLFCLYIVLGISFICGHPINAIQFGGFLHNQNSLGFFCVSILPGIIYGYRKNKGYTWLLSVAVVISLAVITTSRTALVSIGLELAVFCILSLVENVKKKDNVYKYIANIAKFVFITILSFFVLFFCFTKLKTIEAEMFPSIQLYEDKSISLSEWTQKLTGHYTAGMGDNSNDALTSGRVGIWTSFVENLEVLGHEVEEREIVSGTRHYTRTNAHNSYIQVAYDAGIFAGLTFLLYCVCLGIISIYQFIKMIKEKEVDETIICAIAETVGFGVITLGAVEFMIYAHFSATMFYIFAGVLLRQESLKINSNNQGGITCNSEI